MAKLPISKVKWYRKSMQKVSNQGANAFIKEFNIFSKNANNVDDLAKAAVRAGKNVIAVVGDDAQNIGMQYFDYVMQAEKSNIVADYIDNVVDTQYYVNDVYYNASLYSEEKITLAEFKKRLEDSVRYYIKRSAHESVKQNCKRNRIYYALVPSGGETCAFCFMLASRGFVYSADVKEKYGKNGFHKNCDCVLTPSVKGKLNVGNYNPDLYYERYKEATYGKYTETGEHHSVSTWINRLAEDKGWDYMWGNKGD